VVAENDSNDLPPVLLTPPKQSTAATPLVSQPEIGVSEQSRNILKKLPAEKIRPDEKSENIDVAHTHKNPLEDEVKKHNGIGIEMSVRKPRANISRLLESAYNALIAGNQEEAIGLYKQVLEAQPSNELGLFGLATTYHRAGQIQMARPLYGKLLAIDPHNVEGLNNFLVLLSDEDPKDALAELDKLEKSHPGFSPISAQMAIIYERMGNYDLAMDKMNRAISLSPENLKYRYDMAIILDKKGDWANAAVFYKQLLTASERGEKISASPEEIQHRLTFIQSNKPKG
jgi:Flp pilus assembly protein TadD